MRVIMESVQQRLTEAAGDLGSAFEEALVSVLKAALPKVQAAARKFSAATIEVSVERTGFDYPVLLAGRTDADEDTLAIEVDIERLPRVGLRAVNYQGSSPSDVSDARMDLHKVTPDAIANFAIEAIKRAWA